MQETVAAGERSPIKKPSESAAAKQAWSAKPGFQPSAAAQFTAIEISSGRIGRMRKPFMAGDPTDGLMNRYHTPTHVPGMKVIHDFKRARGRRRSGGLGLGVEVVRDVEAQ